MHAREKSQNFLGQTHCHSGYLDGSAQTGQRSPETRNAHRQEKIAKRLYHCPRSTNEVHEAPQDAHEYFPYMIITSAVSCSTVPQQRERNMHACLHGRCTAGDNEGGRNDGEVGAHGDGLGAIGFRTSRPHIEGLAALHHNAWGQGVSMRVHHALIRVVHNVPRLQSTPQLSRTVIFG